MHTGPLHVSIARPRQCPNQTNCVSFPPQARVRGFARATSQGADAASPHPQRTRPDNVVVIHASRIGSPLFLILSIWMRQSH